MAERPRKVPLPDSELPELAGTKVLEKLHAEHRVEVTLHLRHGSPPAADDDFDELLPDERQYLDHDEFTERHGIDGDDLAAIERFAREHDLVISEVHAAARMVELEGTADAVNRAFHIELEHREDRSGRHRSHRGNVHVPEELADIVQAVTGLDDRTQLGRVRSGIPPLAEVSVDDLVDDYDAPDALQKLRITCTQCEERGRPFISFDFRTARFQSYFPRELAELYNFPDALDGSGETIGIFAFQGGYDPADLEKFCKLQNMPVPEVVTVPAGSNRPDSSAYSMEVTADVQVAATVAPGARIVIYYADPRKPHYFLNALKLAIHDRVHRPSVISISYGYAEGKFKPRDMQLLNAAFRDAAQIGITVCVASGDGGSATSEWEHFEKPAAHVNYPANCPYVLACGGTALHAEGERVMKEIVFNHLNQCRNATGGGLSTIFPRPPYQRHVELPRNANHDVDFEGRGVPDVAGNAAAVSGYNMMFQGKLLQGMGGTSFVAPLWAALIARVNQGLRRRVGFINPYLYQLAGSQAFRPIVEGFNGAYYAREVWNPCTGLGTPDGTRLYEALQHLMVKKKRKPKPTTPGNTTMDVMSEQVAAYNDRDLERFIRCYAECILIEDQQGHALMQGHDAMRRMYGPLFEKSTQLQAEILNEVKLNEWVVQDERVTGIQFPGLPPAMHALVINRLADGKIAYVRFLVMTPLQQDGDSASGETPPAGDEKGAPDTTSDAAPAGAEAALMSPSSSVMTANMAATAAAAAAASAVMAAYRR